MIVEAITTVVIVGALLYVAPGILGQVKEAAPPVFASDPSGILVNNYSINPALNASQSTIGSSVAGGLSLTAITPIMLGVGIMIAAFMLVRRR